jgi:hypothetical protein
MQKIRRSTIDDLASAGFELAEEHLRLASGGYIRVWRTTIDCWDVHIFP